ncbi:unnamed protein product [Heligmosomoides polygyrus]|uniref:Ribonuclease P/MRP protein subunit POP5 n=1 Tax=Heligmosomoides polygyrus TaxID=6339 RepID=A0A183GHL8_HELPZ|nr:unnamed protein product [Heligmosomoides polygyrus]
MVKSKSRYVLLEIHCITCSTASLTPTKLFTTVAETVAEFHGDYGFAACRSGLAVKVVDGDIALIRVDATSEKFVTSVLPFITKLDGAEVVLRSLVIGRSIRSCEKFLIKYRRNELYGLLRTVESGGEFGVVLLTVGSILTSLLQWRRGLFAEHWPW